VKALVDNPIRSLFRLKKPCSNCPFLKEGAIELQPGRLDGIVKHLLADDWSTFRCHKTVHNKKTGGEWDDVGRYHASGKEAMCMGAAVYLEKLGRPTVAMRIAMLSGMYDQDATKAIHPLIIDPDRKAAL